jgi:prevent-host-death family protein
MPDITATEFKARCLELMDRVMERGETYVITKRNRPVAKLAPVEAAKTRSPFGSLIGELEIAGDIVATSVPRTAWNETLGEWDELNALDRGKPRRRTKRRR